MITADEHRQRQEAYRNLIADLDVLFSPKLPIQNPNDSEDSAKIQKLFEDVRLISFVGHALTNYMFMNQNFVDPHDRKRREFIYELATSLLQSSPANVKSSEIQKI